MKTTTYLLFILVFLKLAIHDLRAAELDQYGGTTSLKLNATGFFRVEEIGDRWFFVTPEGHPYIALGANHVGSYLKKQAKPGGLFARHAGDTEKAAEALLQSLRDLGLNAGDAYQPEARYTQKLPWVSSFHYLPDGSKMPPNIFDPEAMSAMHEHVRERCARIADNPWVLGVAGPDLPRWDSSYAHPYRIAESGSLARQGYEAFLKERHQSDIASLNRAYGTKVPSWEALASKPRLNLVIDSKIALADEHAFLGLIAERHFAAVRAACKAGAPKHLYFGERTQLRVLPATVLSAKGKHIDVFCTQSLIRLPKDPPEWQVFQREHYDLEYELVGKPMVIIDWAAPFTLGEDPVSSDYGTLKPEREAGEDAFQFVHDAFEQPYMIGLFICQVIGNHGNDKFFTNAKRTYLKDDGTDFSSRTALIRKANLQVLETVYGELD